MEQQGRDVRQEAHTIGPSVSWQTGMPWAPGSRPSGRCWRIEPRYGVAAVWWALLVLSVFGFLASQGRLMAGLSGPEAGVAMLGSYIGAIIALYFTFWRPGNRAAKRDPACRDVSELCVSEQGIVLLLNDGRTLTATKVDGAKLKANGMISVDERLVFYGVLSDGSEGRQTIFKVTVGRVTLKIMGEAVARAMAASAPA